MIMSSSRCFLKLPVFKGLRLYPASTCVGTLCARSTSTLSNKQKLKGFTVKDQREPRQRVAKEKRKTYVARRQASFQDENAKAMSLGLEWGIKSALLLERLPVIVEDYPDWQQDFWNLQAEQAMYGAEFPAELGFNYSDEKPLTVEELLERSPIPLAPRRTEADKTNDRTTLDRALDERLMLIVKPTPDADWRLPESGWEAAETIRQAAERTARQLIAKTATTKGQPDDVAQLYFVGNCPAGWFWRTGCEEQWMQQGKIGDKIFINKVQLICGQPKLMANKAAEHLWVTKHEIREYLGDEMGVYLNHVI
ncbi:unnamed protein product [Ascophyllum nodosum]